MSDYIPRIPSEVVEAVEYLEFRQETGATLHPFEAALVALVAGWKAALDGESVDPRAALAGALGRKLVYRNLVQTCFGCPSAWEGETEDGKELYVRFRHGYWRVDVDGTTVVSGTSNQMADGVCSWDDILEWAAEEDFFLVEG